MSGPGHFGESLKEGNLLTMEAQYANETPGRSWPASLGQRNGACLDQYWDLNMAPSALKAGTFAA